MSLSTPKPHGEIPVSPGPSATGGSWEWRVTDTDLETVAVGLMLADVSHAGLSEEHGVVSVWFSVDPTGSGPTETVHTAAGFSGSVRYVANQDWQALFRAALQPVQVGPITVAAPWHVEGGQPQLPATPLSADRSEAEIILVVEPGMAFGTGHHWTTTACLEALLACDLRGKHLLDVGTGTGVLALAGSALGAERVTAFDVDPEAVAIARINVETHRLDNIDVSENTTEALRASGFTADVVVANIITDKLLAILPDLLELTGVGGTLICCGIGAERLDTFTATFPPQHWEISTRRGDEWALLVAHRLH